MNSPAALKAWVRFPISHYKGDPNFVPQLTSDEVSYFTPSKNPAFQVASAKLFTATLDGRPVGRICGIINELEVKKRGKKVGRFGWFESIDDEAVAGALLDAVGQWLVAEGCEEMSGPHGFSDLDPGGILLDGFDQLPTISGSYNYPYYARLLESHGLEGDADYIEFRASIEDELPFLDRLRKRLDGYDAYRVVTFKSRKKLLAHADDVWRVLQQAFEPLYGVVPLTPEQTQFYTKQYFSYLDPELVKLAFTPGGELVGFFIGIPNLSTAFQKAGGSLFPFGFVHLLKQFRRPSTVDFLLAGSTPEVPSAVSTIGFIEMYDTLRRRGVRFIETNRELESNTTVNRIWRRLNIVATRRTRIFKRDLR
ncbi:MAG: hypothetical protein ACR2QM_19740 [Longimicrobiales bacterium]